MLLTLYTLICLLNVNTFIEKMSKYCIILIMAADSNTQYKLMILYMIKKVSFMLSNSQIQRFFGEYDYISYIKFQTVLNELIDTGLIEKYTTKTQEKYALTKDGESTLDIFINDISESAKSDIDEYIQNNKYKLKQASSLSADYKTHENNTFSATLKLTESNEDIINLTINGIPDLETVRTICEKWPEKAGNIYKNIMKQLL